MQTPLRILIDTNVAYTFLTKRTDKFSKEAEEIMFLCSGNRIKGYIAFHSISTMWYLGRKSSEKVRREIIGTACDLLKVVGASQKAIISAVQNIDFRDFEDCLQDKCAKEAGCDYIVTANLKDFANSEVPAVTPDRLLKIIHEELSSNP